MTKKLTAAASTLYILMILTGCSSLKHGGKSQAAPGTWQATAIAIDGDSKDWPSPYPNYDADAKIAYATSNDGENLYITMETGDEMTQLKMLKQGMIVSVDVNGKKEPAFHISYPLQNNNDISEPAELLSRHSTQGHTSKQLQVKLNKLADDANQFSLDGFGACNGGYLSTQAAPCGIKVRMRMDEYKELVWEAVVPLKAIGLSADAGKTISVCYAIKAFKTASTKGQDNSAPMSGNNNMAGGGMHNSMPSHGGKSAGRSMGENPMQHLYDNTKTWKFFGIAAKP